MIQVYGYFTGNFSWSGVCRGMAYGLAANGLDLQIYNVDRYGGYEGLAPHVVAGGFGLHAATGWKDDAPVGLFIGGHPHQSTLWLDNHPYKVGLFIAESEVLPANWVAHAKRCDLCLFPSQWVRDHFVAAGVAQEKTLVVHHGLHPVYGRAHPLSLRVRRPLNFLHVCGAVSFLDRKGTPQLIEGFRRTFRGQEAKLVIRSADTPELRALITEDRELFEVCDARTGLAPHSMRYYLDSGWEAIIQPSRAEAFGIVPLEARALGVPVICTGCTGHAEHAQPEMDTIVKHGPSTSIRVNFVPNGVAPSVSVEAICEALDRFLQDRDRNHETARAFANDKDLAYFPWQWRNVCGPLATRLGRRDRREKGTTLGDKLGVG